MVRKGGGQDGRGGGGRGRGAVQKPPHHQQKQHHGAQYQQQQQGKKHDGGGKGGSKGGGKGGGGHQPRTIWAAQPELQTLHVVRLDDAAKEQIGGLFRMMDANGDGKLEVSDFEHLVARTATEPTVAKSKALILFTKLRQELDFDSDGVITPTEFINGVVKLAIQQPVGHCLRTFPSPSDPISYTLARLEMAANNSVKEHCKSLYNWMSSQLA